MKVYTALLTFLSLAVTASAASTTTINGLPNQVAVGDTFYVTASGSIAPYSWSSSHPAVVQVTQLDSVKAEIIVLGAAPSVMISATSINAQTDDRFIAARHFSVRIADTSFIVGDTVEVPVYYTDRSVPFEFLAADITLPFDTTLFRFIGVSQAGALTSGMTVLANRVADEIKIGVAATLPVPSAEKQLFLTLRFAAKDTVAAPESRPLHFTQFRVNETEDGVVQDGWLVLNPVPNYPPHFIDTFVSQSMNENGLFTFTFTAADSNGDDVHFLLTLNSAGGAASLDSLTGLFSFSTTYNDAGTYDFEVTASDGNGGFTPHTFTVTVDNVNRSPVFSAMPDTIYIKEGVQLNAPLYATDPDLDPLRYHGSGMPIGMTVDSVTGTVQWTPGFFDAGSFMATFTVKDQYFASAAYTPIVVVIDSNRTPLFTIMPADSVIPEGYAYGSTVQAADPDGDVPRYYLLDAPPGFLLDSLSGAIAFLPTSGDSGTYQIVIKATDGKAYGDTVASYWLTVTNVNLPPQYTLSLPDTMWLVENTPFTFDFEAMDPDGDPVTFYALNLPAGMTFDSVSGVAEWTPTFEQEGEYTPTFKVRDPFGLYDYNDVRFIVLNMNRPPLFASAVNDTTVNEGQMLELTFTGSDPDGDSLTFYLLTPTPNAMISTGGVLQFQPSYVQAGVESLIVMLSDGAGLAFDTVAVTVLNTNNPPVFMVTMPDTAVARFDTLWFPYFATDNEGDHVSYSLLQAPSGASIDSFGVLKWGPPPGAAGDHLFVVQASDSLSSVTDTAVVRVYRLGDVSGNGAVSSFDAGLILRDQVGAIVLDQVQLRVGNVSGDSTISSTDASLILQYVVSLIDTFPAGLGKRMRQDAVPAAFAFTVVPGRTAGEYDLVVTATRPSNVVGLTMSVAYDTALVTPLRLVRGALTDSMTVAMHQPPGRINLAAAGTSPLSQPGDVARFTFTVNERTVRDDQVLFTMKRFVLNERDYADDIAGITLNVGGGPAAPTVFALGQNYPNPFNPSTTITYQTPRPSAVTVTLFNLLGQEVRTLAAGERPAGYHSVTWDGRDDRNAPVSSGVYLYTITARSGGTVLFTATKKMLLVK